MQRWNFTILSFVDIYLSAPFEVFKECQESWKAIVIDEFQDTSAMQYGLLQLLASHKRLTIVGDEDQVLLMFGTLNFEIKKNHLVQKFRFRPLFPMEI